MDAVKTLVVGAGVAGLACASALRRAGRSVRVIDKGRSVGGRCASWRSAPGVLLDYGPTFLHGADRSFLASVEALGPAGLIEGWPARIRGVGTACQPRAYSPRERRFGLRDGIGCWPKALARTLDVRLTTELVRLEAASGQVRLWLADGSSVQAPELVLTLPCEQLGMLLERSGPIGDALPGARALLRLVGTVPCLTLLAAYPREAATLDWDTFYPEQSALLKLVSNESSKRPEAPALGLVLQARARWSRKRLDMPREQWSAELLGEAGRLLGSWATTPSWARAHVWHFARTDASSELAAPLLVTLEGGGRVGFAGELFARGAGLEAAWLSGRQMARRLCDETDDGGGSPSEPGEAMIP